MTVPRHFSQDDTAVAATMRMLDKQVDSKIQREKFLLSLNTAHGVFAEGFEAIGKMLRELGAHQHRSPNSLAE